jgi:hypothetical protein
MGTGRGPILASGSSTPSKSENFGALPMIKANDWTEAETEHLLYLIDGEYWRLWRRSHYHFSSRLTPY